VGERLCWGRRYWESATSDLLDSCILLLVETQRVGAVGEQASTPEKFGLLAEIAADTAGRAEPPVASPQLADDKEQNSRQSREARRAKEKDTSEPLEPLSPLAKKPVSCTRPESVPGMRFLLVVNVLRNWGWPLIHSPYVGVCGCVCSGEHPDLVQGV